MGVFSFPSFVWDAATTCWFIAFEISHLVVLVIENYLFLFCQRVVLFARCEERLLFQT